MSPISKFTIVALASTALAVPFAGHGHAAHGHLHKRVEPVAYGGASSSEADAVPASSAPEYTYAPVDSSSEASAVVPTAYASSSEASAVVPTAYVSSSEASAVVPTAYVSSSEASAVVPTAYVSSSEASAVVPPTYDTSSEASAIVPTAYASSSEASAEVPTAYASSSNAGFTYSPVNSTSAAATIPTYGSVKSSTAAATVPASYPVASSSEAAHVPSSYAQQSNTKTTTTVKTTRTKTVYTTIYMTSSSKAVASQTEAGSAPASAPAYSAPASKNEAGATAPANYAAPTSAAEQCAAVTVTATKKVTEYVTVQPSGSKSEAAPTGPSTIHLTSTVYASYANSSKPAPTAYSSEASAPAYEVSSSSEAAAVPTSSEASAPAYVASSSSEAAAVPTSSEASAPAYSAPAKTSEAAAILPSSYAAVNKGVDHPVKSSTAAATIPVSSTASAPASYSSAASTSGGKRGLAYNDASLTTCFAGSNEITWAYNWGSSRDGLSNDFKFIPTLWGTREDFTSVWDANVKECIADGSDYIFSFNEPDHNEQSSMTPAAAATAYQQYMNPLKGQAKLCAPSVTNGGGEMGLTWLQNFLDACGSDCEIDCLNVHWYDSASNTAYFKQHIQQAIDMADGKPVFVSEFGATGSDDEIASFLEEVMPWMDSNGSIAGYAYFMVKDGDLVTGSEPSSYGTTYKTYTS